MPRQENNAPIINKEGRGDEHSMVTSKDGVIEMNGDVDTIAGDVSGVLIAFYEQLKADYDGSERAVRLMKDLFLCMLEAFFVDGEMDRFSSFQTIFLITAEQIRLRMGSELWERLDPYVKEIARSDYEAWIKERNGGVSS